MRESAPSDESLACPICTRLFVQAVKTPERGTTFCEECIQTHLLEHNFVAPDGEERIGSLDRLEDDWEARAKVEAYIGKEIERRRYETDNPAAEDADEVRPPTSTKRGAGS